MKNGVITRSLNSIKVLSNDFIATHPQLVQELIAAWGEFAEEYGVVRDNRISNFERLDDQAITSGEGAAGRMDRPSENDC